ncbi:isoamyl acetate-hydrolyzing esterase [Coemansia nantahalensis]|uniref:Isoamyl acetate-hydrolyzing esterase n=1 Tax=Coemansia nantahalensis TaxID=2789366 RepID=A0ACC1JTJ6_9FUNG|nr:isoamyl acetate-hydrolyzing esterase [Coemansia nantahalensis]KAJ2769170.1 isoamyl acetate-hydrolyzing esterase [Coemansia nantahalensis]
MPAGAPHPYDLVVLFGDSLTQHSWDVDRRGWSAQLARSYARIMDVVNRGYGGFNTRWGRVILPRVLPPYALAEGSSDRAPKLQLFVLFFGANDAAYPSSKLHVPLEEFKDNLRAIVDVVRSPESELHSPHARFLMVTPPAFGEKRYLSFADPATGRRTALDRDNAGAKTYAAAVCDVASQLQIPCVDLWTAMEAAIEARREQGQVSEFDGYDEFLWDGLHLSDSGNELLFGLVRDAIKDNYPDIAPDALPFVIPGFKDFADADELAQILDK